jgi:hypothetical protein
MAGTEFEEREYEAPLYQQLQHSSNNLWSPGQVLEAHVGFDHSLFTSHPYFWRLHGFAAPPAGVVLGHYPPEQWWHVRRFHRPLPDFALNLFIQAKRPIVGARVSAKLKTLGLTSPYWKFEITPHQQCVLEALSQTTSGSALVCYACAAFHRITELWAHSRAGSMVESSTFPRASTLSGHEVWYYVTGGCTGYANPEPERIEEPPLAFRLSELASIRDPQTASENAFSENLKRLGKAVVEAVHRAPDSGRSAVYFETLREIDRYMDFLRPRRYADAVLAYLKVAAFVSIFQLQWHVVGGEG